MNRELECVIPAVMTALKEDNSFDEAGTRRLVRYMVDSGIRHCLSWVLPVKLPHFQENRDELSLQQSEMKWEKMFVLLPAFLTILRN